MIIAIYLYYNKSTCYKMDSFNYGLYGYDARTTLFIPYNTKYEQCDRNLDELKKRVDAMLNGAPEAMDTFKEVADTINIIVNGTTDNGKVDTFVEAVDAIQSVEGKIPEMTALTEEEVINAEK